MVFLFANSDSLKDLILYFFIKIVEICFGDQQLLGSFIKALLTQIQIVELVQLLDELLPLKIQIMLLSKLFLKCFVINVLIVQKQLKLIIHQFDIIKLFDILLNAMGKLLQYRLQLERLFRHQGPNILDLIFLYTNFIKNL